MASENGYQTRSWVQIIVVVLTIFASLGVSWGIFSERISNLRDRDASLLLEINQVKVEGSKPTVDNTLQIEVLKKSVIFLEEAIKRVETRQASIDGKLDIIMNNQAAILLKLETHLARDLAKP